VDSGSQEILDGGQNAAAQAPGGAGTQTAQWIVQLGAEAIITGNIGPKAHSVIAAAGVPVYLSPGGTAREALEAFSKGELKEIQAPSVQSHSGMRSQGQS
jgi:predicted Fe-Mo cluster-binding NifX family protein